MPLYQYECKCGHSVELLRSMADRNFPMLCEKCNRLMDRVMTSPNFGKPAYRMTAILENGSKVQGNFGQRPKLEAPTRPSSEVK